jgi:hypothetical protein
MAGTGHPYEIVNRSEVIACLGDMAMSVTYPEGREWLRSKHLVKTVTAPACVIKLSPESGEQIIRDHVVDPAERDILLGKFAAGGDLRMFSRELLKHVGPDLSHIADWLNGLPSGDLKTVRKLPRITYTAAVMHAERWVSALAREASRMRGSETTEIVLETSPGKVWLELLDRAALLGESSGMNHCVADYSERLGHGTRIFSLRDHHGKSVVTVEIVGSTHAGLAVGQIKGHSNLSPSQTHRRDIVSLLNHLGVQRELHRDAERSAITRTQDGTWTSIVDVAERTEVLGYVAYRQGNSVFVISPSDLQSVIANIYGPALWWTQQRREDLTVVAVGDVAKHTLAEQRVLASFANDPDNTVTVSGASYLVKHADVWMPWLDTCERWELDGVQVLYKCGVVYLMSASENRIVARIERSEKSKSLIVNGPETAHTASASETRRLAMLMSALDVEILGAEASKCHRGIRPIYNSHKWFYVPDHAVERQTSIKKLQNSKMKWTVTPWHASLDAFYGLQECTVEYTNRMVEHVRLPFRGPAPIIMELCRTMNDLRLVPSHDRIVHVSSGKNDYVTASEAENNQQPFGVIYVDGTWRRISSLESFLAHAERLGPEQFSNASCNETALKLMFGEAEISLDDALASHLGAWSRRIENRDLWWNAGYMWVTKTEQNAPFKRLIVAAKVLDQMSAKDRASVLKAVTIFIKNIVGRSSRPKIKLLLGGANAVMDLVLAYGRNLPAKDLLRYTRWVLSGYVSVLERRDDGVRPDARWFSINDHLKDGRVAYGLKTRLWSDIWSVNHRKDNIIIEGLDDATTWIAAIEIAVSSGHIYEEAVIEVLSRVEDHMRGESGDGWEELKARARKVDRSIDRSYLPESETMAA